MKKVELLAPAGNMECLISAIKAGCDAIYLGGYLFSARGYANNFSNEEMIEAVNYAHLYNVKVYVTLNTVIYEDEVDTFINYIDFLHNINVDAIIIQDLGMMDLVHQLYPSLELHASTQMFIHNLEGINRLKELGVKRVVLARELTLEEINYITSNTDLEIEIFIHGSLCTSYSGECYMSASIGDRSGNRGTCAQSCRQLYQLLDNDEVINDYEYLLSSKDLNTITKIDELIESNVSSLKIEGRMKSKEYVYLVVSKYRKAIDSYYNNKFNISNNDILEISKMFNREFTLGHLYKDDNIINPYRPNNLGTNLGYVIEINKNIVKIKLEDTIRINDTIRLITVEDIGIKVNDFYQDKKLLKEAFKDEIIEIKLPTTKDIEIGTRVLKISDITLIDRINEELKYNYRKINIDIEVNALIGKELSLNVKVDNKVYNIVTNYIVEMANKIDTTKDRIIEQLSKLNETPYKINKVTINKSDNCFINIKELNELRRQMVEILNENRLYKIKVTKGEYHKELNSYPKEKLKSILIKDKNIDISKYDIVYVDNLDNNKYIKRLKRVNDIKEYKQEVLITHLGQTYNQLFRTDYTFNVTNSYTLAYLHSIGAKSVTLSYELTYNQVEDIISSYIKRYNKLPNVEVITKCYMEVMLIKHNYYKMYNGTNMYLKDRLGNKYKLINYDDYIVIQDYKLRELIDDYYKVGVNIIREEV